MAAFFLTNYEVMGPGVRRDDDPEPLATARHTLYGASAFGDSAVTRSTGPARAPWAILVLTVSALALGACGRKGGLDLPPQAAATPMGTAAPTSDPDMNSAASKGSALTSPNQAEDVQATRGRKRSFFLDPILD